ncbi:MAG TPA: hypothetical protein VFF65_06030 [Phycisphaerales bacterium]|nr:hypothetical protein [Phycisphaerales bacterium]
MATPMEPDGYTQWDRLPVAYPRLHEGVRGSGPVDCLLRCVARIEPYELAARAVADRGPAHPATQRALAGLADDYRCRADAWGTADAQADRGTALRPLLIALCGVVGPFVLVSVIVADPRLAPLKWWPAALLAAPLALPMMWTAAESVARIAVPRPALKTALRDRRCPDCAASLSAVPDAINPSLVEDAAIGPRACPRCRRPWPLLPPPADAAPALAPSTA